MPTAAGGRCRGGMPGSLYRRTVFFCSIPAQTVRVLCLALVLPNLGDADKTYASVSLCTCGGSGYMRTRRSVVPQPMHTVLTECILNCQPPAKRPLLTPTPQSSWSDPFPDRMSDDPTQNTSERPVRSIVSCSGAPWCDSPALHPISAISR